MTRGAQQGGINMFQGRYVMLHPWTGPIECKEPQRGVWGGPVNQVAGPTMVANNTAFVPRGAELASFLQTNEVEAESSEDAKLPTGPVNDVPPLPPPMTRGCASCATANPRDNMGPILAAMAAGAIAVGRRLRRKTAR
jgi:hypothetical protein